KRQAVLENAPDGQGIYRAAYYPRREIVRGFFSQWLRRGHAIEPVESADAQRLAASADFRRANSEQRSTKYFGRRIAGNSARVHLVGVDQKHMRVEAYHGEADNGDIRNPTATMLNKGSQLDTHVNYIYQ